MKLNYYSETDSLYIDLTEHPSVENREVAKGIVLDYDADDNLVSIEKRANLWLGVSVHTPRLSSIH